MGITSKSRGKAVLGGVTVLDDVTIKDALAVTGTSAFTGTATFSGKALIADELYFQGADACAIKFKSDSDYTDGIKIWDAYFGQEGAEFYADGLISVQAPIGTDYYIPVIAHANITEK